MPLDPLELGRLLRVSLPPNAQLVRLSREDRMRPLIVDAGTRIVFENIHRVGRSRLPVLILEDSAELFLRPREPNADIERQYQEILDEMEHI